MKKNGVAQAPVKSIFSARAAIGHYARPVALSLATLVGGAYAAYIGTAKAAFPTAAQYLTQHGHDPALIQKLTSFKGDIRIRNSNTTIGKVHEYFDFLNEYHAFRLTGRGESEPPSYTPLHGLFTRLTGMTILNIAERNESDKQSMSRQWKISPELIERDIITAEDSLLCTVLHEIRHTRPRNQALVYEYSEPDAERAGNTIAAEAVSKPEIVHHLNMGAALNVFTDADIALQMDLLENKEKLPSPSELRTARREAYSAMLAGIAKNPVNDVRLRPWARGMKSIDDIYMGGFLEEMYRLKHNPGTLSPLAQRRVDLYVRANEYFMPTFAAKVKAYVDVTADLTPTKGDAENPAPTR